MQFKYSITSRDDDFRASHAKKTITKFATAFLDHRKIYGEKKVREKLEFELITNRPIYAAFHEAITGIADEKDLAGDAKDQAKQFKAACGLEGKPLAEFAGKCLIIGLAGSLTGTKRDLSRILVDWSATTDPIARARLGNLRQLVREKAGHAGSNSNVISRVDVLAALEISEVDELLPSPPNLPEVGPVVEREQLADAITLISKLDKPLLIHAAGGVGKTVFLDSLRKSLSEQHEVLFFDCFGGGAYRDPGDSRHLPKRGLLHIANSFACRGLCDPLLPDNNNVESLISAFRRRLLQCVTTLSTASMERQLILFIDAIDNAAQHAKDRHEDSFPTLLLKSFHYKGPIPGVKLVVSCRSHRIGMSMDGVPYLDFKLKPFSRTETGTFLRDRLPKVTETEIRVAQARSKGNARILEHLVSSDRGLLDPSEIGNTIELDDLLSQRIEAALTHAEIRGYKESETNAFIAGLSVLPPPVPLDEYAGAHGMDISAIESFAADLAPLLEQTKYGLMFRDEPTESLIREKFGSDENALGVVAANLFNRQDRSVYAARSLPALLQKIGDGEQLFALAFDERFPDTITSTVGKRNIRYARLKAAVLHAANHHEYNHLVHLLVELSTIAAVDQRGSDYILDHPDLVIAAQDVDATRRLFETRTKWPGTRHSRLAIANVLSGDFDNADRHAASANEWIYHYRQQDHEHDIDRVGPESLDVAAIPFCLTMQNRAKDAIGFMRGWRDWFTYEVCEYLFAFLEQAKPVIPQFRWYTHGLLVNAKDDIGVIASALSNLELDKAQRGQLIQKLTNACKKKAIKLDMIGNVHRETKYRLQDGLLKAAVMGVSLGLGPDALTICDSIAHERPSIWSFDDPYSDQYVFPFLAHVVLRSAVEGKELQEQDILPKELYEICPDMTNTNSGADFRDGLKRMIESRFKSQDQSKEDKESISYEKKISFERFIGDSLAPLLTLAKAFTGVVGSPINQGDKTFLALLNTWNETRRKSDRYTGEFHRVFQRLGCKIAVFVLWARSDLKAASVRIFLERLHEQKILSVSTLIEVVEILARRNHLHTMAGEQALKARSFIENQDDVGTRASLYAQLARAILPASREEAAIYFRAGLEQMDAIGSGDYQFTNELLLFASCLRGDELAEQDFHTLTNICELNMPWEEEKFPWAAFASGLSRTSGCKTLAKLARWDDRSKISLDYTLLPYLTALIRDEKIAPEDALALLRLSNPVELWTCNTETLVKAIEDKKYPNQSDLIGELIHQFECNNPGVPMDSTVEALASVAEKALGKRSETTTYLFAAYKHFKKVREESNEHMNYRGRPDQDFSRTTAIRKRQDKVKLKKLATRTTPIDEVSLAQAVNELNEMQYIYDLKGDFFGDLRAKVVFSDRPRYIQVISSLENLNLYTKLDELKKCKSGWGTSSVALTSTLEALGIPLLQRHADDFVDSDYLALHAMKELSDLSGVSSSRLALELMKIFAKPDASVAASVWLALASAICGEAEDGEGQAALKRLLNSNAAKLASKVLDGEWKAGIYPANDPVEIFSGLVWRMLGSPNASDRWRAAHSVRCFAKFERLSVIDALVARFAAEDAHPFQAPELRFYYMHARLWLLIALARIALDHPRNVARYQEILFKTILDEESLHVLMRHFAAEAIRSCAESGNLKLSAIMEKQIRDIDVSPFRRRRKRQKEGGHNSFYQGRPKEAPKPKDEFHLDYDFDKYDVHNLSDVFGKAGWEIKDLISEAAHSVDPDVKSMYESGGREISRRDRMGHVTAKYHSYGQQIGWHSLFIVAGRLLRDYPVTKDSYSDSEDPWTEWLNRNLLTRKDGYWLSDGMDRPPLDTNVNLLEKGEKELIITGSKSKLLNLVNIDSEMGKDVVVEGDWTSHDGINVSISSALVALRKAKALAERLTEMEPFSVWLPVYEQSEDREEYLHGKIGDYIPWIVCPSWEGRLDGYDPLASICTMRRPHFAKNIAKIFSLKSDDSFKRAWKDSTGMQMAYSEAWGYVNRYDDEASVSGVRLLCSGELLRDVLAKQKMNLLILIKLRRYEKGIGGDSSRFSHTIAVIRIKNNLDFEFYKGAVNKLHENKY